MVKVRAKGHDQRLGSKGHLRFPMNNFILNIAGFNLRYNHSRVLQGVQMFSAWTECQLYPSN